MANHPMAAGLTGNVGVVSTASSFGWGRPAAAATARGHPPGHGPAGGGLRLRQGRHDGHAVAPARRVGFFASDDSARYLGPNGVRLFNAALDWLLTPDPI